MELADNTGWGAAYLLQFAGLAGVLVSRLPNLWAGRTAAQASTCKQLAMAVWLVLNLVAVAQLVSALVRPADLSFPAAPKAATTERGWAETCMIIWLANAACVSVSIVIRCWASKVALQTCFRLRGQRADRRPPLLPAAARMGCGRTV